MAHRSPPRAPRVAALSLTFFALAAGCRSDLPKRGSSTAQLAVGDAAVFRRERFVADRYETLDWLRLQRRSPEYEQGIQGMSSTIYRSAIGLAAQATFDTVNGITTAAPEVPPAEDDVTPGDDGGGDGEEGGGGDDSGGTDGEGESSALQALVDSGDDSTPEESTEPQQTVATLEFPSAGATLDPAQLGKSILDRAEKLAPQVSPRDKLRDRLAFRDEVDGAIRQRAFDDTHDLSSSVLYELRFDLSLIPGHNAGSAYVAVFGVQDPASCTPSGSGSSRAPAKGNMEALRRSFGRTALRYVTQEAYAGGERAALDQLTTRDGHVTAYVTATGKAAGYLKAVGDTYVRLKRFVDEQKGALAAAEGLTGHDDYGEVSEETRQALEKAVKELEKVRAKDGSISTHIAAIHDLAGEANWIDNTNVAEPIQAALFLRASVHYFQNEIRAQHGHGASCGDLPKFEEVQRARRLAVAALQAVPAEKRAELDLMNAWRKAFDELVAGGAPPGDQLDQCYYAMPDDPVLQAERADVERLSPRLEGPALHDESLHRGQLEFLGLNPTSGMSGWTGGSRRDDGNAGPEAKSLLPTTSQPARAGVIPRPAADASETKQLAYERTRLDGIDLETAAPYLRRAAQHLFAQHAACNLWDVIEVKDATEVSFAFDASPLAALKIRDASATSDDAETSVNEAKKAWCAFGKALDDARSAANLRIVGVSPDEQAERLSNTAQAQLQTFLELAAKGKADANTAIGARFQRLTDEVRRYDLIKRNPLITGFVDAHSNQFGWILAPRLETSTQGPAQLRYRQIPRHHSVSVRVIAGALVEEIALNVELYEVLGDGSWRRVHGAGLERSRTWRTQSPRRDEEAPDADIRVDLPWDREAALRGVMYDVDPTTATPSLVPGNWTVQEGQPARLVIQGRDLWRSPQVFIGGQPASRIHLLPDLGGVAVEFEKMERTGGADTKTTRADLLVSTSLGTDVLKEAVTILPPKAKKKAEPPKAAGAKLAERILFVQTPTKSRDKDHEVDVDLGFELQSKLPEKTSGVVVKVSHPGAIAPFLERAVPGKDLVFHVASKLLTVRDVSMDRDGELERAQRYSVELLASRGLGASPLAVTQKAQELVVADDTWTYGASDAALERPDAAAWSMNTDENRIATASELLWKVELTALEAHALTLALAKLGEKKGTKVPISVSGAPAGEAAAVLEGKAGSKRTLAVKLPEGRLLRGVEVDKGGDEPAALKPAALKHSVVLSIGEVSLRLTEGLELKGP